MITPERQKIIDTARSTLGPPPARWRHQGRDPATGIDCAGLVIWTGWETGYFSRDFDVRGYRRTPDGKTLSTILAQNVVQTHWGDWKFGDFVLLRDIASRWPCHMGFLVPRDGSDCPNLLHSWARFTRGVTEVRFDDDWRSRMAGVYRFKGVI